MKTFALVQGDLVPAAGGYLMYEGRKKIHQDLSLALLEEYGTDEQHPGWGSVLQNYVGAPLTPELKQQIISEVTRVINNYITVQNARILADDTAGNRSSLTTDDVVNGVSNISVQQVFDSVVVTVTVQTLSRQDITINQVLI